MAVGKEIEKRNHIIGFIEEIETAKKTSKDTFFGWFNGAKDTEEAFISGAWDFSFHIINPIINEIKKPEKLTILEIGHGGGRILASSARFFKKAIGIDIHNENDFLREELLKRGVSNIDLYKVTEPKIPLVDNSVDLVYSFIVMQHIEKIEYFNKYISEIYRVLNKNGLAVIYFGRLYKFSLNKTSKILYWIDRLYEKYKLKKGYIEIPTRVNEVNLRISVNYAKKEAKKNGFIYLKTLVSRKNVPNGINKYGGQNGLILIKK